MLDEHVVDLLPAYALGSLDDDELVRVAGHLARCAQCRSELTAYENTVDQLALAGPLQTPPADLKTKIMQRVEQSTVNPPVRVPRPVQTPQPPRRSFGALLREMLAQPTGIVFAFAALLLMVILAGSSFVLWQRVNDLQARVPADTMQVVHLAGTNNAPGTRGYMMVFKNENYGTLVVEDAPMLQTGYQYQLWLIKDGKRTSGGVFSVDGQGYGTLQVSANSPLNSYSSFGVTIEPAGGSPGPTGKKVLGGDL